MKTNIYQYRKVSEKIPLIPYVTLELRSFREPEISILIDEALLDTGSCVTLIPLNLLETVGARSMGSNETIIGICGELVVRDYWTTVVFNGHPIPLKVKAWNGEITIIGRDLINKHRIDFNGPTERFTIYTNDTQNTRWWRRILAPLFMLFNQLSG